MWAPWCLRGCSGGGGAQGCAGVEGVRRAALEWRVVRRAALEWRVGAGSLRNGAELPLPEGWRQRA